MKKLDELLNHNAESIGKRLDIGDFGERIINYGNYIKDMDKGFFPFILGKNNDYWAELPFSATLKMNEKKERWILSRGKVNS